MFAVAARAKIESAAVRLSIVSSILVVTLLLLVYRSPMALGLGLLPVATGALVGIESCKCVAGACAVTFNPMLPVMEVVELVESVTITVCEPWVTSDRFVNVCTPLSAPVPVVNV